MRKVKLTLLLSLLYFFVTGQEGIRKCNLICLKIEVDTTPISMSTPDSVTIHYLPSNLKPWSKAIRETKSKLQANWVIASEVPITLTLESPSAGNGFFQWYLEPGDSIIAHCLDGKLRFDGRGADKLNLHNDIFSVREAMTKPSNQSVYTLQSLADYLEWETYLNKQFSLTEALIESYKGGLSREALIYTKVKVISYLQQQLWYKFVRLPRDTFHIDRAILTSLYDRGFLSPAAKWMRAQDLTMLGEMIPNVFVTSYVLRQYNFPIDYNSVVGSNIQIALKAYELGKSIYQGEALEYFLARYLTKNIIAEFGFTSEVKAILQQYYGDKQRDVEYKDYVRSYEQNARVIKRLKRVPDFTFYDNQNNTYSKADLKGKVLVLNFFDGYDKDSKKMILSTLSLAKKYEDDPYVFFFNIFSKKGISKVSSSVTRNIVNVNLKEEFSQDSILENFNITHYPASFVVNLAGRLITSSFIDSTYNIDNLINVIKKESEIAKTEAWQDKTDGPYILEENGEKVAYSFFAGQLKKEAIKANNGKIVVATDEPGKTFEVSLKEKLSDEVSGYLKPEKLIAISDIEGNFDALRIFLLNNKVIDENYDWIFGKGHLVFTGDMFDRGEQVTECLWLMYSLEGKAKSAGGYVHFILGNHELMNLEGNHKYTRDKYKTNAERMGKSLMELYGLHSELGRWLRTKNIAEKIGDILFVHGGISKELSSKGLTVGQINELAKPYYDKSKVALGSGDERLKLLYDTRLSPFWYREYYLTTAMKAKIGDNKRYVIYKTPLPVVDQILQQYHINRIVTGHSIYEGVKEENIGKWISVHYSGKIINIDTHHAAGYTEALLIEDGKYYRLDKTGIARPLSLDSQNYEQLVSK
jgi:hypothetical protein